MKVLGRELTNFWHFLNYFPAISKPVFQVQNNASARQTADNGSLFSEDLPIPELLIWFSPYYLQKMPKYILSEKLFYIQKLYLVTIWLRKLLRKLLKLFRQPQAES